MKDLLVHIQVFSTNMITARAGIKTIPYPKVLTNALPRYKYKLRKQRYPSKDTKKVDEREKS